jgi:hypothetical protein
MKPKKFIIVVFVALLISVFSSVAYAATPEKGPWHKLGRGFAHIGTSIFLIPKNIIETTSQTEPFYMAPWSGMTMGLGKGGYEMGRQAVSGFFDLFTFFTPAGRDWAPLFEASTLFPEL